jgi:glucose-6-phosphate isomerase
MAGGFGRKRAREQQRVRVDANGLRRDLIGDAGLDDAALLELARAVDEQVATLDRQRRWLPALPAPKADVRKVEALAADARGAFADLVVIAPGDLALGIRGLVSALVPATPGNDAPTSGSLRVHVLDALDPDRLLGVLGRLDLRRTLFDVVSGTGEALPTISQFVVVRERLLRELGAVGYRQHVIVTTQAREGALRQIVNDEGFRDLVLPEGVADDAALLTAGALFPVACTGADPAAILAGATAMAERCRAVDAATNPLHLLVAALHLGSASRIDVTAPARGALADLGHWITRRVARRAALREGRPAAVPPLTLILAAERPHQDVEIPTSYQDVEGLEYLGGQGLAALAAHERDALEVASWRAGRPSLTLTCPELSAHELGQLVALVEAATSVVRAAPEDAQGDPARLAFGLANRPGFETERAEAQRLAARREDRYVA